MTQVFNPANVMVHQQTDGTIPEKFQELILKEVMESSKVMQLGKFVPMDDLKKKFSVFLKGPGAYWISETQKIPTSKATWGTVEMEAKKLGVILPVSKEYLQFTMADFFNEMKPRIAEAFYRKFDEAVILDENNPFKQSIAKSILLASNGVTGDISYDNILAIEDKLLEHDIEGNAWISKAQNVTELRQATKTENGVSEAMFDRASNKIDGLPAVNFKSTHFPKGSLIFGDFDYLYYGIPQSIEYKIDESAQLSTLVNEDGSPINLFEQDMVALRVTMYVAMMVVKDEAFAGLNVTQGTTMAGLPSPGSVNSNDPDAVANTYVPEPAPAPVVPEA